MDIMRYLKEAKLVGCFGRANNHCLATADIVLVEVDREGEV